MEHLDRHKIANIAHLLMQMSDGECQGDATGARCAVAQPRAALIERVRIEQLNRKRRSKLFAMGNDIFSDPAWDILLELFAAELAGHSLNASVIGCEAGIPQSTALRWLGLLEKMGLTQRRRDVFDKRRLWVALTLRAKVALESYFS